MEALGFRCLLPSEIQAPIIVTFHMPADPRFNFADFYERLSAKGFLIYPGKLTVADSFRIGCIGQLDETEMRAALEAIASARGNGRARRGTRPGGLTRARAANRKTEA